MDSFVRVKEGFGVIQDSRTERFHTLYFVKGASFEGWYDERDIESEELTKKASLQTVSLDEEIELEEDTYVDEYTPFGTVDASELEAHMALDNDTDNQPWDDPADRVQPETDAPEVIFDEELEPVENEEARVAAWRDVQRKAKRLRNSGSVMLEYIDEDMAYGQVKGDHGVYTTSVYRGGRGIGERRLSTFSCSCKWGEWVYNRGKYYGRLCSHGAAILYEMQAMDSKKRRSSSLEKKATASDRWPEILELVRIHNDSGDYWGRDEEFWEPIADFADEIGLKSSDVIEIAETTLGIEASTSHRVESKELPRPDLNKTSGNIPDSLWKRIYDFFEEANNHSIDGLVPLMEVLNSGSRDASDIFEALGHIVINDAKHPDLSDKLDEIYNDVETFIAESSATASVSASETREASDLHKTSVVGKEAFYGGTIVVIRDILSNNRVAVSYPYDDTWFVVMDEDLYSTEIGNSSPWAVEANTEDEESDESDSSDDSADTDDDSSSDDSAEEESVDEETKESSLRSVASEGLFDLSNWSSSDGQIFYYTTSDINALISFNLERRVWVWSVLFHDSLGGTREEGEASSPEEAAIEAAEEISWFKSSSFVLAEEESVDEEESKESSVDPHAYLLEGSGDDGAELALRAEAFLKEAGKAYTLEEQQALIDEEGISHEAISSLDLEGTHYLSDDMILP